MAEKPISVREAMDHVLEAERLVQQQLRDSRVEAADILSQARNRAKKLDDRAQQRIAVMQERVNRATAARIREMRRHSAVRSASIEYQPSHSEAVARAAAELAMRLSSADNDHD